jgi:hypothetical protein
MYAVLGVACARAVVHVLTVGVVDAIAATGGNVQPTEVHVPQVADIDTVLCAARYIEPADRNPPPGIAHNSIVRVMDPAGESPALEVPILIVADVNRGVLTADNVNTIQRTSRTPDLEPVQIQRDVRGGNEDTVLAGSDGYAGAEDIAPVFRNGKAGTAGPPQILDR